MTPYQVQLLVNLSKEVAGKPIWSEAQKQIEYETKIILNKLKEDIGKRAYNYLRRGGEVKVWRRSSPHNIYIETKKRDLLWHSSAEGEYVDNKADRGGILMSCVEKVEDSKERVVQYWGADSGSPVASRYKLRPFLLA